MGRMVIRMLCKFNGIKHVHMILNEDLHRTISMKGPLGWNKIGTLYRATSIKPNYWIEVKLNDGNIEKVEIEAVESIDFI